MTEEEKEPNYWGVTLLICAPIIVALIVIISFVGGPLHRIWFDYFWSSDKGNGPEAIQQTILYGAIAAVLIPAVRHFVKKEFNSVHEKIEEVHDHLHHVTHEMGLKKFERKK